MNRRIGRHGGQALVEFALVIPLILLLVFGALDIGRAVWALDSSANAAREGARYAIVHGGSPSNTCPVGPPGAQSAVPASSPACPHPSPSKDAIRDAARRAAVAAGGNVTVQVCYGVSCAGDTDTPVATNDRGTPVTVHIESHIDLVATTLLGLGPITVEGTSTMLVNH